VDDAQLVAGALAGKAECYDALYMRYRSQVWSAVTAMGVPESAADDMAQEILAAVCLKLAQFDPTQALFSTWVIGFAKKAAAKYWRAQARHPALQSLDATPEECMASDESGPAAVYERKLLRQSVRDLVCRLRPKLREPVILYWFNELSVAEIARVLGRPDSTVRDQLKEGMRDLRTLAAGEAAFAGAR